MYYLRIALFYLIKFMVLLLFAIFNLYLIDAGSLVNAIFIFVFIMYYAFFTNAVENKLCNINHQPRSNTIFVKTISTVLRTIVAFVFLNLLMNLSFVYVMAFFVLDYMLFIFNKYTIYEFLTLSRVESIEE